MKLDPATQPSTTFLSATRRHHAWLLRSLCRPYQYKQFLMAVGLMAMVICMMPQMGDERNFNYRVPPAWGPENEHLYSFR